MEFQRARESELGTIQQETTPKTTCGRGVHPLPLMGQTPLLTVVMLD